MTITTTRATTTTTTNNSENIIIIINNNDNDIDNLKSSTQFPISGAQYIAHLVCWLYLIFHIRSHASNRRNKQTYYWPDLGPFPNEGVLPKRLSRQGFHQDPCTWPSPMWRPAPSGTGIGSSGRPS